MTNVIPLGITHDPGCNCRRCLTGAYRTAKDAVSETTRRYQAIRGRDVSAAEISQARQQWTEARQVLILAEHALRTAEDGERIETRQNRQVRDLHWNPEEAL